MEKATTIFICFSPGSKSPITLLELELHASSGKVVMVCPKGFWRRGNIEVVASKFNVPLFDDLDEGLESLNVLVKFSLDLIA